MLHVFIFKYLQTCTIRWHYVFLKIGTKSIGAIVKTGALANIGAIANMGTLAKIGAMLKMVHKRLYISFVHPECWNDPTCHLAQNDKENWSLHFFTIFNIGTATYFIIGSPQVHYGIREDNLMQAQGARCRRPRLSWYIWTSKRAIETRFPYLICRWELLLQS